MVDRLTRINGQWAVVMEYVEGVDLRHLIAHGPLPARPAVEIVGEVASALHVAYTREGPNGQPLHLIHRDIKPPNIQITPDGGVKVLDFGIARAEFRGREGETHSLRFGTPEYMSPERIDMVDGPEGDIYALGAVLYESLVDKRLGRTSSRKDRHSDIVAAGLGSVPAGTYTIRADFPGWGTTSAGKLTVGAGETLTLRCVSDTTTCRRM